MGGMVKGIGLIVAGVLVVAGLHFYVYAPMQQRYSETQSELSRLQAQYRTILGGIQQELGSTRGSGGNFEVLIEQAIQAIRERNNASESTFNSMNEQLTLIDHFDPTENYREQVLSEIERIRELEQSSQVTELNVSNSYGVFPGIREGRFGTGYYAEGGRSMAFSNLNSTQQVINPRQGTLEFWVKPDWDPMDRQVHHKCLFMAIYTEEKTREEIEAMHAALPEEQRMTVNLAMMMQGSGPFPVESLIAVYKGEGPTLTFEMQNEILPPSTVTATIGDWNQGQWYHIACIWESRRQALYINGANKGVPFGGGVSIRNARDMEDEMLLTGGMGGGMGMGMGMGMMGGMMGMGMGGMMGGGMGMGMGMGGMMGGGMMGGMMGGGMRTSSVGQTLTSNISLPSYLTGVYLGADETGAFPADCTFDGFHIRNGVFTGFNTTDEPVRTSATMLLDNFEDDLPAPETLPFLMQSLQSTQQQKSMIATSEALRERFTSQYELVKHAFGIDTSYLESVDRTIRIVRELHTLNYISQNLPGYTVDRLVDFFEIDPTSLQAIELQKIAEFQRLCYDLAQQAVEDRLIAVNEVINKGQGYYISDDELRTYFNSQLQTERQLISPTSDTFMLFDYGVGGGGGGMGMGMGMMGGGMGMGMMGMGMMGMGGMGGAGGQIPRQPLMDPETGDPMPREASEPIWEDYEAKVEMVKNWGKFQQDGLVPPDVIDRYNQQMLDQGMNYYIKRSLAIDFDADFRAAMDYFYNIEFGTRINTINTIEITSKEDDVLNVLIDVEGHFIKNLDEEIVAEGAGGYGGTGPIGMN